MAGNFDRKLQLPRVHFLLHAVNMRHGTNGFTSLPKEGVLRIFSPWKIRRLRPGLNPRTWVPKASTLPKPLPISLFDLFLLRNSAIMPIVLRVKTREKPSQGFSAFTVTWIFSFNLLCIPLLQGQEKISWFTSARIASVAVTFSQVTLKKKRARRPESFNLLNHLKCGSALLSGKCRHPRVLFLFCIFPLTVCYICVAQLNFQP